jgi:glycine oxidase
VKGQIVRLRGREPLTERLVRTPRCYVVSRPDGEVVVGATVEDRGFDTTVTAGGVHRLLEAAWEVLPEIEELELVEAAARLRPATPDNVPVIGERDGVIWATGHYRNGVLLAPVTADAVIGLLTGAPVGVA